MSMFVQTNTYLDNLKRDYPTGGIVWLYMWDIIRDVFTDIEDAVDGDSTWGDLIPVPGVDLETVWKHFERNPWGGFDVSEDDVLDWLSAEDMIQDYEEEEE